MKVYKPIPDGLIPDSNGLFIQNDQPGGWLLRFGEGGASIWFPSVARLCRLVTQPDAPAGASVPSEEVRATLRSALRLLDIDLMTNHTYIPEHLDKFARLHAALNWLDEIEAERGVTDAAS